MSEQERKAGQVPDTGTTTSDALSTRLAQQDREVHWLREAWAAGGAAQNPNDFKAAVRDRMWAIIVADLADHASITTRLTALADRWEREAEEGRRGSGHPLLVQTYAAHARELRAIARGDA